MICRSLAIDIPMVNLARRAPLNQQSSLPSPVIMTARMRIQVRDRDLFQYKNCLSVYIGFHCKDKTVMVRLSHDHLIFIMGILTVWETLFLGHSPENRCLLYVLYKIPLARANFLLTQIKKHSHWRAGEC